MWSVSVISLVCAVVVSSLPVENWSNLQYPDIYVETQGDAPSESRIIGGSEATPNSYPYQVALFIQFPQGRSFCGGSIISENYILTAAHCMDNAKSAEIVLGAHDIRKNETTQMHVSSDQITVHPDWSYRKLQNDVALIKLPEPITFNQYIQPISLASTGTFSDSTALLTGWGKTSDFSRVSNVLNQVNLPVLENKDCSNYFQGMIESTHVCTSGADIKGGCNGDSGGPLVFEDKQIGIVSFGSNRCTRGFPTVFTRVSEFKDWIAKNSDAKVA